MIQKLSYLQPIYHLVMSEHESKLINHAVCANRTTNKLKLRVVGVVEDEMVLIEVGQTRTSNATRQLNNAVLD
jgi:uncharacterized protein YaaW (UPF0174 family)